MIPHALSAVILLLTITFLSTETKGQDIEKLKQRAEAGDEKVQLELGKSYYNGQGVTKDFTKAIQWFSKAASQGNSEAFGWLGSVAIYDHGVKVEPYNRGKPYRLLYPNAGDLCRQYTYSADLGFDGIQPELKVAYNYALGEGVPKNYVEAVRWYTKASQQGHPKAQMLLGLSYKYGLAVEEDDTKATSLFNKAIKQWEQKAEQGNAEAQYELGQAYNFLNELVYDDHPKAELWFIKAAEQGHAEALYRLEHILRDSNPNLADHYLRKAAAQGCAEAQYQLGLNMYWDWYWARTDQARNDESMYWLGLAEEQGRKISSGDLGGMTALGSMVDERAIFAERWFSKPVKQWRREAEEGNAEAQFIVGFAYNEGWGVEKNDAESYMWLIIAKAMGFDLKLIHGIDIDSFIRESEDYLTFDQIIQSQHRAFQLHDEIRKRTAEND